MSRLPFVAALAALLGAPACDYSVADITSVPDHPTYQADVRPLYEDHCNLCHGEKPDYGAPTYFRLDVYGDANGVIGAGSFSARSLRSVERGRMPPVRIGSGLGPNGTELLRRWVADGSPE